MDESTPTTLDEAQQLLDDLRQANQQLSEANAQLHATNQHLTETVTDLQSQVAWMKRQLFGSTSERVTDSEAAGLFDDQPEPEGAAGSSSNGESEPASQPETVTYQRKASKRGKRQPIPDDVPRVDHIHDLPEEEKAGLKCIGQQVTEELEGEPGKVYAVRHIQYTYAREEEDLSPEPEQPNVITAEKPDEGLPRCLAGPTLLALIVVSKFADHSVQGEAVAEMREGLSWSGSRTRPQTSPNCCGQEPWWEASDAKGVARPRQVRSVKSSESEPSMTCRKRIQLMSKPGLGDYPGISVGGACSPAHVASGIKAARARIRLSYGTLEPVVSMPREKSKRRPRKGESTDARHRGGTTRSSVEGCVMHLERRGRVIGLSVNRSTASVGGAHG